MKIYKKGQLITGVVTGIEKYGAFVKIDDEHNGLIHISQISNLFVKDIKEYIQIGEIIKAEVIEDCINCAQIKLSIKNINYNKQQSKEKGIQETKRGFKTLKSLLNYWIENKMNQKIIKLEKK